MLTLPPLVVLLLLLLLAHPAATMNNNEECLLDEYPILTLDTEHDVLPECNYYDFIEIPYLLPDNNFNILIFNIRSCRKNFNDFVNQFAEYFHNYDIIVLMETWLTTPFSKLFSISGFKHFDSFRSNDGGGLRVFFKKALNVQLLTTFTLITGLYEMLTVEISFTVHKIILCVFYHPPSADHNNNHDFIHQCYTKLNALCATGIPIISCGDFNLNLFNPLKLRYISDFIDSMLELGMIPVITIPTKYNPDKPVTKFFLIDQIWTNIPGKVINPFVIPCGLTDHFPASASFELVNAATKVSSYKKREYAVM